MGDRITEIRVEGLRTLADVRLRPGNLTVLIGENGSGKSSLLEACELLRRCATPSFIEDFVRIHRGMTALARTERSPITLGVTIDGAGSQLDYEVRLRLDGAWTVVDVEQLTETGEDGGGSTAIQTQGGMGSYVDVLKHRIEANVGHSRTLLGAVGDIGVHPSIARVRSVLSAIDVHVPFAVRASWTEEGSSPMRSASPLDGAKHLERTGRNLANAWHALKNNFSTAHWDETLDLVRLGLGEDIDTIHTSGIGGGTILLSMKYKGIDRPIPAVALSDGALAYLGFVALCRLNIDKSLLAFDEPETHLHPALLMRVVAALEGMSAHMPVILATQSDALLDALSNPAGSVVLCDVNEQHATRLRRPDPEALETWLTKYRGLGEVRSAGFESAVMTRETGS